MTPTDWSRVIRLSAIEFQACWATLDLGDTPLSLDLHPPGDTPQLRQQIYTDALTALQHRRVAQPSGVPGERREPNPPLAQTLRLLATAPLEYNLRLTGGLVAIGAVRAERGVVAVRTGDQITLLPMSGPHVTTTLVELVGPLHPGRAQPVNIPADTLDRAHRATTDASLWTLADHLVRLGVTRTDAHSLARMCTAITAAGQLGATHRHDNGTQHRTPWVIGFHRTHTGDYLQLRRPHNHHGATVTVAPITTDRLLAQLHQLIPAPAPQAR